MPTLKVKEFTNNELAVSAAEGEKLNVAILKLFRSSDSEPIVVDFDGIELIISAFLNPAIGKLYKDYSSDEIRRRLSIVNMNNDDKLLLKFVVEHAKKRFQTGGLEVKDDRDLLDED